MNSLNCVTTLLCVCFLLQASSSWVLTSTPLPLNDAKLKSSHNILRMDVEASPLPNVHLPYIADDNIRKRPSLREALDFRRNLPWSSSIQDASIPCTYMPFWAWQLNYFERHLTNFRQLPFPGDSVSLVQSKSTRVLTKWYSSDEYRLIRMTYMDAGNQTQIFASVCYPRGNLPILGHGLLQCGGRRITISDFQPLEESHSKYDDLLLTIRDQFPSLNQPMSKRHFEDGRFWSNSTMLGRFPVSSESIWQDLWPAFKSCVQAHVQLCKSSRRSDTKMSEETLLHRHAEYDAHVASRDPAIGVLSSTFGSEVARSVVYEALFPLADPPQQ